jgi:hypothetical protein
MYKRAPLMLGYEMVYSQRSKRTTNNGIRYWIELTSFELEAVTVEIKGEEEKGRRDEGKREKKETMQSRKTRKKRDRGNEELGVAISLCEEQLAGKFCKYRYVCGPCIASCCDLVNVKRIWEGEFPLRLKHYEVGTRAPSLIFRISIIS